MKISDSKAPSTITMTTTAKKRADQAYEWWNAANDKEKASQLLTTAAFLKENQNHRQRSTAVFARLYGNQSLYNFAGSAPSARLDDQKNLPLDRPTFNIVSSCVDTLVSRISQNRPQPVFLTDNGDYRERNLAKKLNNFILGEFYQCKAYEKVAIMLRDALVTGTGILKVYENGDHKAALDRVLQTELFTDANESMHGDPRQMYQLKLMDRKVLMAGVPAKYRSTIEKAEAAYPDSSSDSSKTVSDLVMVVEGWRLPSGKDTGDGRHTIACTSGLIVDEEWTKDKFPFIFLHYSPRLLGFWAQGLAEQLLGTQLEINQLLYTITRSIKLVGVPRVFIEKGSKVSKASNNNDVGVIVEYTGVKPSYEVAPCVAPELYEQLERLIQFGYQQSGVSAMQASSQKPGGLDSGEAIRTYDDISADRFAALNRRYDNVYIDLAYQIIDLCKEIAERDGEYSTVYPNKNSAKEIDLPKASLLQDPFVIQCFNMSSLPRDPAGRMAKISEMVQAGMISIKEGRRLLDYPDLSQVETLANASEERIFQILDGIVETNKYVGPDPFMDLDLATQLVVQYYNLYAASKLEEDKLQSLRDFYSQVMDMKQAAMAPPPGAPGAAALPQAPGAPQPTPQASPMPLPQSPLVPNAQG